MRMPVTNRQCARKPFYIFFRYGGKYSGCYTVIQAQSYNKAVDAALQEYGSYDFYTALSDKTKAEAKIKSFGLTRL